ncbi:MAG: MBL fold metallo-hydrolase [Patescibacteria group bacterium]
MQYQHGDLNIETLSLGELNTNCYLVWDSETQEAMIIDPADEGSFISEKILELKLKPKYIVLTHAHFDHILGLLEVKLNFDIPILMHEADNFLLESLPERAQHWLKRNTLPAPAAEQFINEPDQIAFGNFEFKILNTPGHTPGSICIYNQEIIFSGDTLFKNAIGRTDLSYSNPQAMRNSLQKIFELNKNLVIYPGHGEPTTIQTEKQDY